MRKQLPILVLAAMLGGRAIGELGNSTSATGVAIEGEKFLINGVRTFAGGKLDGTLPNSRMVQATFDDANPATVGNWKYPDGSPYSAARQTREFVAALPGYRAKHLLAVTVNFQGGNPVVGAQTQPWDNTAFNSDGSLKAPYLARMDQVIRALDRQGMVAILGYFYFGQDQRLSDETAVKQAVTNATQWVLDQGYTNVLIEIDNEADMAGANGYQHDILRIPRVAELITAAQTQSANYGRRLYVGVSLTGGQIPPTNIMQVEDFILLHGNGQNPSGITAMISAARAAGTNKPIVINEDSVAVANFQAAVGAHASWGYFDAGRNNYVDGFQSPPTNWTINTPAKMNFFNMLNSLASPGPNVGAKVTVSVFPSNIQAGADATFTISTSSVNLLQPITVQYSMSGSAKVGADYTLSGGIGAAEIPAGASSTTVVLHALKETGGDKSDNATMTLTAGPGYSLSKPKKAKVVIANGP